MVGSNSDFIDRWQIRRYELPLVLLTPSGQSSIVEQNEYGMPSRAYIFEARHVLRHAGNDVELVLAQYLVLASGRVANEVSEVLTTHYSGRLKGDVSNFGGFSHFVVQAGSQLSKASLAPPIHSTRHHDNNVVPDASSDVDGLSMQVSVHPRRCSMFCCARGLH